jgi:hypothetical protein
MDNKKTKTPPKKLKLSRETMRTLTDLQLKGAAAGQSWDPNRTNSCGPPISHC